MNYLSITAVSVSPAAVELPFSVFKLVFLIAWAYLCLYSVQKIFLNPTLSTPAKTFANLLAFFIGPVVLLIIFLADIKKNSSETSTGFMESIREHFHSLAENLGKRRSHAPPISILDSSGRNITELYSHGERAQSQDRHVLDMTQQLIYDAVQQDASDILIDPKDNSVFVARYRIDGVLHEVEQIDAPTCQAVINSIKAVSNMDIAEKRRPQDGAFVAKTDSNSISFRVASAGVLNGEKLSIRVLNQDPKRYQLDSIGLTEKQQAVIIKSLDAPSGMILLCGPTGSGKTTTMYAMLNKINLQTRNVITVEDPIEYVLPQASQMEVNEKAGITFAKSLRSMLRQDPDVICVGEIRDEETAQIALRAAQTGHLVLATVHSTSNASALIRLMDLGVTPAMLSTGLSLIIAQRLVRNLCEDCKKPADFNARQVNEFRRRQIDCSAMFQPVGCAECHYSGYRGRTGVYDLLVIDETIKKNILNNEVALSQLRKEGSQKGKSSLRKQGMRKVVNGTTSLQELMRVLGTSE